MWGVYRPNRRKKLGHIVTFKKNKQKTRNQRGKNIGNYLTKRGLKTKAAYFICNPNTQFFVKAN